MTDVVRFALLGLGLGAIYTLAAQGLVVTYRGSGVINFAHGAIGTAAAYLTWELDSNHGWPYLLAAAAGVALAAALGVGIQFGVMRHLAASSALVRLVATLGIFVAVQSLLVLRYGSDVTPVPSALPSDVLRPFGDLVITADRLWLAGIAIAVTVALWLLYRSTAFGRATTAVAESQRTAAALGWAPNRIATLNWGLGGALAAIAGILAMPIIGLTVTGLTSLVLAALAAALVASFRSFPVALGAGILMGVLTSLLTRFSTTPGLADAVPFLVIVVMLVLSGRALPMRGDTFQRLPRIGSGRVRPQLLVPVVIAGLVVTFVASDTWASTLTTTMATGTIFLSIVVVTGYAGQVSLAQFVFAGIGALIAGRLVANSGVPFELALVIGVIGTVPVGVALGLPAVRTRGVKLAIITLGLASAVHGLVFNNPEFTGGQSGTKVGDRSLFGLDIDGVRHPQRYAAFAFVTFVLAALVVTNLRRGRAGRRLLAVRTNERAAAALGISPWGAKLYAFAVSAAIAALGGILLAFRSPSIVYSGFVEFQSVVAMSSTVIGGLGFIVGPVLGAALLPGSVGAEALDAVVSIDPGWLSFASGAAVVFTVLSSPDGIAGAVSRPIERVRSRLRPTPSTPTPATDTQHPVETGPAPHRLSPSAARGTRHHCQPRTLELRNVRVRYAGVVAVDDVSFTVAPGEVVGLIGSNGAGKSTVIDAITGFTKPADGLLLLDGQAINRWSASRRNRAGISRSFQTLELFDEMTVRENLQTAADRLDPLAYLADLVHPAQSTLSGPARDAIRDFGLDDDLSRPAESLPYSRRRLLAVARAVATAPSILLLDEPAAGLGHNETDELQGIIQRLAHDAEMGILVAEHDMAFVMGVCHRIVVVDAGRVIADGPPAQIQDDPIVISAYLGETNGRSPAALGARTAQLPVTEPAR